MRRLLLALTTFSTFVAAAPPNRIRRPVDARRVRVLPGGVHCLAQQAFDRCDAAPSTKLDHLVLMAQMSAAQQAELDQLLAVTPEEFGLSPSDHSTVVAWLTAEGFQGKESGQGRGEEVGMVYLEA